MHKNELSIDEGYWFKNKQQNVFLDFKVFFLYLYFEIVQSYFENSFQLSDEDFFAPKMQFLRGCKIYVCI